MFCRNCGKELAEAPDFCVDCGARPTAGTGFCSSCGAPTTPLTEICSRCGAPLTKTTKGKAWKARTAGILAIVAGTVSAIEWIAVAVLEIRALGWVPIGGHLGGIIAAVFVIVVGSAIVAILGGVFALRRERWRLALAGSVCAIFSLIFIPVLVNVPLAIAAIVLVVLGRSEFEQSPRSHRSCESDLKEFQG